jgi:hypothetical protein
MKCSLTDLMITWRSIRRCPLLLFVLLVFTLVSHGQTAPPDVPSGFLPGPISIFAGNGNNDTTTIFTSGSPTATTIGSPTAVAADSQGNIFIADGTYVLMVYAGGTVPQILAAVTTKANPSIQPQKGDIYEVIPHTFCNGCVSYNGGPADQAPFQSISSMWFDSSDNLYIADALYYTVVEIDHTSAYVHILAGQFAQQGTYSLGDTINNVSPTSVKLGGPNDVKLDAYGNIYIADDLENVVLVVYSGSQAPPALIAEGVTPTKGNLYTLTGVVANSCYNIVTETCASTGPAEGFILGSVRSIDVDAAGNVYILDNNSEIALVLYAGGVAPALLTAEGITPSSGLVSGNIYAVAGYNNLLSYAPCTATPCGDGGLANDMFFSNPFQIAVDTSGNVYIADGGDHAIRKIDTSGYGSTIAGIDDPNQTTPTIPTIATNGAATSTSLNFPGGVAFDPQKNLYIADTNYYIVWQVGPALPQTITFPTLNSPVTYGISPISLDATASSMLAAQYLVSSTSPATINGSNLVVTGAGTIDVTASQPGGTNGSGVTYAVATPVTQHIIVDKAQLTVTANDASKVYGQPNPVFSATFSGFIPPDTLATSVIGQPAFSTTATTNSPDGPYPIVITQGNLASNNYTFANAFVNGTLTITGNTPQTIAFAPLAPITYGQTKTVALTATASSGGPVSFAVSSGPGTISGSTLTITGGGTVVITASQQGFDQYQAATPVTQSLVVNPVSLTVTAPTLSYPYGTVINTASFPAPTITGFVNGDTASLAIGSAQYATNASGKADAGSYTLTVAQGTLALVSGASANYTFANFVPGSLTITKASQAINNLPLPTSITYAQLVTVTTTTSSRLPVSASLTGPLTFYGQNTTNPSANANSIQFYATGIGPATITLTQTGSTDYTAATPVVFNYNIGQAPLTVGANNFTREQGAPNPTFTYGITGFGNGDTDIPSVVTGIPVLTTTATQASSAGTYAIVPSVGTLTATNYYFVFIDGTLTVTPPGSYKITANPSSLTIQRGQSGQSIITITPSNAYQGTITLSCGQLPANVSCTISPSTYTFPGSQNADGSENPALGTVVISTTAGTVVGALPAEKSNLRLAGLLIPGALAGLFLLFARKRVAKTSALWSLCVLLTLGLGMLAVTSCGGSSGLTTAAPGTVTVTITGSGTTPSGGSSTVTATVPLTVTIQ